MEGIAWKTPFKAKAGDLVCYPPSSNHNELCAIDSAVVYQMIVRFGASGGRHGAVWLDELGKLPLKLRLEKSFAEARKLFETICVELPLPGVIHRLRTQAAVFQLLSLIAGTIKTSTEEAPHLDPWQRIRLRISATPSRKINIRALAAELNISAEHFIRQFRARFGISPKSYQTEIRLREAARMLRDPSQSVKSVAYDTGFSNSKSLSRLMKRHLGLSPSSLRGNPSASPQTRNEPRKLFPINYVILAPERNRQWVDEVILKP